MNRTLTLAVLIAHAAKTRPLSAGTIVGSGTVSNKDRSAGSACLAEKRRRETIEAGEAKTPFLSFGDRVRRKMFDGEGASVFGAIEQEVRGSGGRLWLDDGICTLGRSGAQKSHSRNCAPTAKTEMPGLIGEGSSLAFNRPRW